MNDEPSLPVSPSPEAVDQALAFLLKAMEQDEPGDEKSQDIESKMTHLDRLAWRHQVAADALQVAAQKRVALFRRQRNALIPINLPSELLSAILIKAVTDYRPHGMKALQSLAQVAWQWWQTIKSDPQFWTHIMPPMEGVGLQVRKAGSLPLRLYWPVKLDVKDRNAFKNLLQRHAGRWTDIRLIHYDDAVLQALCTNHFPHLKYLRVHPSSKPVMMSGNWRLNLAQCQNLQEVQLPIMPFIPVDPSSNSPLHLRTLYLDLNSMDSYSSYDLESLLRSTPQLVELALENLCNDTGPPAPVNAPIIDLPNLRYLRFSNAVTGDEQEWIPLLAQIRAPRLESLGLHYEFNSGRWFAIGGRAVFTALVTWPSASMNQPEDAPLHSVLRNAGPSAACEVDFCERDIIVRAEGSGPGRLCITLDNRLLSNDEIPRNILTNLAAFGLPVDLSASFWDGERERPEFWDEVLDATPSLRTFTVVSLVPIAREVMDRLSTKAPSPNSTSPRAPRLERLSFQSRDGGLGSWSEGDEGEAVKSMLEKRRDAFIQGGILDPPKMAVTGPNGLLFDEAGSHWLDSESSDARRGS